MAIYSILTNFEMFKNSYENTKHTQYSLFIFIER